MTLARRVSDLNTAIVRFPFICRPRWGLRSTKLVGSHSTSPPLGLTPPGYEPRPLRGSTGLTQVLHSGVKS